MLHHFLIFFGKAFLIAFAEKFGPFHCLLHFLLMLVQIIHVISQGLFSSDCSGDVLELFLDQLFWLAVEKVVKSEGELLVAREFFFLEIYFVNVVLFLESLMLLFDKIDVLISAEIVVFLE